MKHFFVMTAILFLSLHSLASQDGLQCIDKTKTLFSPCKNGQKIFDFKGACLKPNEIESAYCSSVEMTNLRIVEGESVLPWGAVEDRVQVIFLDNMGGPLAHVVAKVGMAKDCKKAKALIGESKAAYDNYDPSQGEIGIATEMLSFFCK